MAFARGRRRKRTIRLAIPTLIGQKERRFTRLLKVREPILFLHHVTAIFRKHALFL